jgi:hypothetical protein
MGLSTAGLNAGVNGVAGAGAYISAHTGNPSTNGANEVSGGSYARQQTTWGSASNGSRVGSQVHIPVPSGTTVTYWGLWSASTSGTFLGAWQLSASESFGADGTLDHTPTLTATAAN